MSNIKPVSISSGAFAFCRYTIAFIFWMSILLQSKELVLTGFIILLISVILKVRRAPLIFIYTISINKLFPSKEVIVDENGIRFAHFVGASVSLLCMIFLYTGFSAIGWALTVFLAILKTSAAFGFCSALKLYNCMNSGSCCRVGKMVRKIKHV